MDFTVKGLKRVFDGFFKLDLYTLSVLKADGSSHNIDRLVLERGHAVAVLGYDPKTDEVLLISELRVGPVANGNDPFVPALPAGMIDDGESAVQAACREYEEETGLALSQAKQIHQGAYVSPGGTSETIALVVGQIDLSKLDREAYFGKPEEGEYIKPVVMGADEYIKQAQNSVIHDLKTVCMAYWLQAQKLQPNYKQGKKGFSL